MALCMGQIMVQIPQTTHLPSDLCVEGNLLTYSEALELHGAIINSML